MLTTVSALLQRVPAREVLAGAAMSVACGDPLAPEALIAFLVRSGYARDETVTMPGDFAARGGIVDVFPPGVVEPLRFDFFGDELETIRTFDSASQRTTGRIEFVRLEPVTEVFLDDAAIERFRLAYRALAGAIDPDNPLYAAVSAGRRHAGMEHWLPLFYERLETLFDYLPAAPGHPRPAGRRGARGPVRADRRLLRSPPPGRCRPLRRDRRALLSGVAGSRVHDRRRVGRPRRRRRHGSAVALRATAGERRTVLDAGGRPGLDFAQARQRSDVNVFDDVAARIKGHRREGRRVLIAAVSAGSRDRLLSVFADHSVPRPEKAATWPDAQELRRQGRRRRSSWRWIAASRTPKLAVIAETDILGERISRRAARRVRPENFLTEASSLNAGDLVVHINHGIGRYEGLETIQVDGASHDCLRLVYAGDDRLFVPVENIDLISRYGSDAEAVTLDRLGGAAWQGRKARLKARIREMAAELIKVAAARALQHGARGGADGGAVR